MFYNVLAVAQREVRSMLVLPEEKLREIMERAAQSALSAMGEEAVRLTRERMRCGYARPILDSGALMADVRWCLRGTRAVDVGNTLPYAAYVHNGTERQAARPYLRDALQSGADRLRDAARQALRP